MLVAYQEIQQIKKSNKLNRIKRALTDIKSMTKIPKAHGNVIASDRTMAIESQQNFISVNRCRFFLHLVVACSSSIFIGMQPDFNLYVVL